MFAFMRVLTDFALVNKWWIIVGMCLSVPLVGQAQDVYEIQRTSPAHVQVKKNGQSVLPDGKKLKVEVVPSTLPGVLNPAPMSVQPEISQPYKAIEQAQTAVIPSDAVSQYQPRHFGGVMPYNGTWPWYWSSYYPYNYYNYFYNSSHTFPPVPFTPPDPSGLTSEERAELEMWRRLARNPIYVTFEGNQAFVEWAGAASRIPIPPNGKIQIKLSPTR